MDDLRNVIERQSRVDHAARPAMLCSGFLVRIAWLTCRFRLLLSEQLCQRLVIDARELCRVSALPPCRVSPQRRFSARGIDGLAPRFG